MSCAGLLSPQKMTVFTYDLNFIHVQWELILIVTQDQGPVGRINTLIREKPHVPN